MRPVCCLYFDNTVLKENSGNYKNKGTTLWNFVRNSGLGKFCISISIAETCYRICIELTLEFEGEMLGEVTTLVVAA